jgi:phage-related protein (TIGR01555 family)
MTTRKPKVNKNVTKPMSISRSAVRKASIQSPEKKSYAYDIKAPYLYPGVVPKGVIAPVMAMDYSYSTYDQAGYIGFPGYPYLSQLAARAEYRNAASALSTELTREWIEFHSTDDKVKKGDKDPTSEKITKLEELFDRMDIRGVIQQAAMHDCFFGRGQIFIDISGADNKTPLILDKRTIKEGSLNRVVAVESVWTTPSAYNANDPVAPDFFKPSHWFMLGQDVHASRLLTVITRPMPDILKAAFNFGGISLSQIMEPYVDNWLRTRQSVSDLINHFSTSVLKTDMGEVLSGSDDGDSLITRAELFTTLRSNKGLMILDKDREELVQINTPLSGLHELQAQSQEHMCAVTRMPAIILTGISPTGLNASSEGEMRSWYDWIAAQQDSFWGKPIDTIFKVAQLSLFGEIDPNLGFSFVPLYQLDEEQESTIRLNESQRDTAYVDAGVISQEEVRKKLAEDPKSGYQGIDVEDVPEPPEIPGFGLEGDDPEVGQHA